MAGIRELTRGRAWAARLLIALPVVAVGALTLAVLPASGNTPDPGPTIDGTLTLDDETFTYEKADGSLTLTQGLRAEKGCKLAYTDGSSQLVSIEGGSPAIGESGSFAGYKSPPKEIGTGEPAEGKGTPCIQANGDLGQVLWLSLFDDLAGRAVWASEIEIAVKFDVLIRWELFSGVDGNGDPIPVAGPAGSGTIDCASLGSDCGADSGRDRVALETNGVIWDAMRLSVDPTGPTNGAFALPADDFSEITNTHFHLVDVLGCGESTGVQSAGGFVAEFVLLDTESCQPKSVFFSVDATGVTFAPPADEGTNFYVGTITRAPEPAGSPHTALQISETGAIFVDIQWAESVTYDVDGNVTEFVCPDPAPTNHPAGWCALAETTTAVGGGNVQSVYTVGGEGIDPRFV